MAEGVTILVTVGTSLLERKDDPEIPEGHSRNIPGAESIIQYPLPRSTRDPLLSDASARAENGCWSQGKRPPSSEAQRLLDALAKIPLETIHSIRASVNAQRALNGREAADDPFPAEISTLYLTSRDHRIWRAPIRLGLLATDTERGLWCAFAIRYLHSTLSYFKSSPGQLQWLSDDGCTDVRRGFVRGIQQIPGLDATNPDGFVGEALPRVAEIVLKAAKDTTASEIILDVTGGFKGVLPFAGVLGTVLDRVTVQSLFESSAAHVRQPALPVSVDALLWTANRTSMSILDQSVKNKQAAGTVQEFWAPLHERLKGLYQEPAAPASEPFRLSPLRDVIRPRATELQKSGAIPRHQHPEFIRPLFQNRDYAETLLIWVQRAGQIWYGDLIPETIEHGRGHAQRLWELAYQMIQPIKSLAPNALTDDELLLLFSTLWVHDVGHAAHQIDLHLPHDLGGGAGSVSTPLRAADISAFPSLVRDLHSFTACEPIRTDKERFRFPGMRVLDVPLADAVALCYRFHRGKLSIEGRARNDFFDKGKGGLDPERGPAICWGWLKNIEKGITDSCWGVGWNSPGSVKFVTALQRILDASDVQAERAGDPDFQERRRRLTWNELRVEWDRLQRLRTPLRNLSSANYAKWVDQSVGDGPYRALVTEYLKLSPASGGGAASGSVILEADGQKWMVTDPERDRCGQWMTRLEREVYLQLEALWSAGSSGAGDALLLEYLSAFDRVVFKYPQVLHYDEIHGRVQSTVIRKTENFGRGRYEFDILMDFAPGSLQNDAGKIAEDVCAEYNPEVHQTLQNRQVSFRKLEAREANGTWQISLPAEQLGGPL